MLLENVFFFFTVLVWTGQNFPLSLKTEITPQKEYLEYENNTHFSIRYLCKKNLGSLPNCN